MSSSNAHPSVSDGPNTIYEAPFSRPIGQLDDGQKFEARLHTAVAGPRSAHRSLVRFLVQLIVLILVAVGLAVVSAGAASAGTCSSPITTSVSGTWRVHIGSDLSSRAVGSLPAGSLVVVDAQAISASGPVTVAGFGTSVISDHYAGGWFSDLGANATPGGVYATGCSDSTTAVPSPSRASVRYLGGVDLQTHGCNVQYPSQGRRAVSTNTGSAFAWVCRAGNDLGIDVASACADQYGYGATAALNNANLASGWFCQWREARKWGTPASSNGGFDGNCTNWALERFHDYTGEYGGWSGDAGAWASTAAATGWTVTSSPEVNSVVVFQPYISGAGRVGHVAWVDQARMTAQGVQIHVSEMNFTFGLSRTDSRWVTVRQPGTTFILAP